MSFSKSNHLSTDDVHCPANGSPSLGGETSFVHSGADRVIDQALRSVPLPEGLMSRLGMLVFTMSDETADRVDYLGC
jgi:hypothetical protein